MTDTWSISTERGTTVPAHELSEAVARHHERVVAAWRSFGPDEWAAPSRNTGWTVHDTARHVADVMDMVAAEALGEQPPFSIDGFDPRTTPAQWMQASEAEDPDGTIERFARRAPQYRRHVEQLLSAGGDERAVTVYGPAHWHLSIIHVFWDSWLHERDVLLALERPAPSTEAEQRLAVLYGLLMTFVPAKLMGSEGSATIGCSGRHARCLTASLSSGEITSSEVRYDPDIPTADIADVADALSGRGEPLRDLLPGAPEGLDFFAAFMSG